MSTLAAEQIQWLRTQRAIDLLERVGEILGRDPMPHRTRRIKKRGVDTFEIGCGSWRVHYKVDGHTVTIERVSSGYPASLVFGETSPFVKEQDDHIEFSKVWGHAEVVVASGQDN